MSTNNQQNSGIILNQTFDSFEEFSFLVKQFDSDFRQLNTENFKPELFQAQIESILISNVHFGCHVEQRGATPPGMRTFAILNADCPDIHWFGHLVSNDEFLVFPMHGEIDCFSRSGFGVTTISIPEQLLREFFERNGIDNLSKVIRAEEIVKKTSITNINELRYLILQLKALLLNTKANHFICSGLQSQLLLTIFNIMTDDGSQSVDSLHQLPVQGSYHTLRLIVEYIKTKNDESLRLDELCRMAKISERSLQYLFKKHLGMTPKAYLKGQKLYKIHRELWHSQQSNMEIRDIANRYGFWHMGQFAADYKKLFGELPSKTLKQNS